MQGPLNVKLNPKAFSLLYLQLGTGKDLSILVYQSGSIRSCK
jgi:hypothetical protein